MGQIISLRLCSARLLISRTLIWTIDKRKGMLNLCLCLYLQGMFYFVEALNIKGGMELENEATHIASMTAQTHINFVKVFFPMWSFGLIFYVIKQSRTLMSNNFTQSKLFSEVFSSVNLWEIVNFVIYFTRAFTSQHFSEADERSVTVMWLFFFC